MSDCGIEKDIFGVTAEGVEVERYSLAGENGMRFRLITFGATVTELYLPDRDGKLDDVVLGFDRLAPYETQSPYFGCIAGRVAFRISRGEFVLDGRSYRLSLNDGPHHLHGGVKGLSHVVWEAEPLQTAEGPAVKLTYRSPDGDQGYPGNLDVTVVYTLAHGRELMIDYTATTDRPTPVNLTNHSYFTLAGAASGDVLGHVVEIDADRYSVTDQATIATGELAPVEGTPFDFTTPMAIGARIQQTGGAVSGYDLSYLLNRPGNCLARAARVYEPDSGRSMEVHTTEPALVFYTGNYLDGTLRGKGGTRYQKHAGFCMETGHLPDAVHHPHFPSVILRPGATYRHTCVYRFTVR